MQHPDSDRLGFAEAHELAAMVRRREVSPVELTDVFLQRIESINPKLNAYVTVAADQARADARLAEQAVVDGDPLGSLHGVPVAIKDLALTRGIRTTSGSQVHADRIPDRDNLATARLRQAGAIILGKTNTPEFGWLSITDNELFGPTCNPWALDHTSGGSSGGAAAAAAAGLAPVSLGSDGGGSIRHPASFCGVFGIKPSFGLVPRLDPHDGWPTLSHQGPLARTVAGAAAALDALAGYHPVDFSSAPLPPQLFLENLKRSRPASWRVAFSPDLGFAEVDPRVHACFEQAVRAFEELGCQLRSDAPDLRPAREIFKGIMFPELVGCELRYIGADGSSKMNPDLTRFVPNAKTSSPATTSRPKRPGALFTLRSRPFSNPPISCSHRRSRCLPSPTRDPCRTTLTRSTARKSAPPAGIPSPRPST
jgi:amidase